MNGFVVFVCALLGVFSFANAMTDEQKAKAMEAVSQCIEATGASPDIISNIMTLSLPDDQAGKCCVACISKKLGFMTSDGKFDREFTKHRLDEAKDQINPDVYEKVKSVHDSCAAEYVDVSDECENAVGIFNCIAKIKDDGLTMKDILA